MNDTLFAVDSLDIGFVIAAVGVNRKMAIARPFVNRVFNLVIRISFPLSTQDKDLHFILVVCRYLVDQWYSRAAHSFNSINALALAFHLFNHL